jgi:hypothetical protein
MRAGDKRAAAAVLRRQVGQLRRLVVSLGNTAGSGWRTEERRRVSDEADELEAVAAGLEDEAAAQDEEDEARAVWAERMATEPRGAF